MSELDIQRHQCKMNEGPCASGSIRLIWERCHVERGSPRLNSPSAAVRCSGGLFPDGVTSSDSNHRHRLVLIKASAHLFVCMPLCLPSSLQHNEQQCTGASSGLQMMWARCELLSSTRCCLPFSFFFSCFSFLCHHLLYISGHAEHPPELCSFQVWLRLAARLVLLSGNLKLNLNRSSSPPRLNALLARLMGFPLKGPRSASKVLQTIAMSSESRVINPLTRPEPSRLCSPLGSGGTALESDLLIGDVNEDERGETKILGGRVSSCI